MSRRGGKEIPMAGWMKHGRDLEGLCEYLVHMGVVPDKAVLVAA